LSIVFVANGASAYGVDGSPGDAGAPAGCTTNRPEIANGYGLLICMLVVNCEPKAPIAVATAGMTAVGGASGSSAAASMRVMKPGKMWVMNTSPVV
jgi:hypothetical protein